MLKKENHLFGLLKHFEEIKMTLDKKINDTQTIVDGFENSAYIRTNERFTENYDTSKVDKKRGFFTNPFGGTLAALAITFLSAIPALSQDYTVVSNSLLAKHNVSAEVIRESQSNRTSMLETTYNTQMGFAYRDTIRQAELTLGMAISAYKSSLLKTGQAQIEYRQFSAELYRSAGNLLNQLTKEQAEQIISSVQETNFQNINDYIKTCNSYRPFITDRNEFLTFVGVYGLTQRNNNPRQTSRMLNISEQIGGNIGSIIQSQYSPQLTD